MPGEDFLQYVPQYGNWGGNGANDAWNTGLVINATLQALQQYNPSITLLTPDANGNYQTPENARIILGWIVDGVTWVDANGNTVTFDRPPINGLDHLYLLHDLRFIPNSYFSDILNHLRLFPDTIGHLNEVLTGLEEVIADNPSAEFLKAIHDALDNPVGHVIWGVGYPVAAVPFLAVLGTASVIADAVGDSLPYTARVDISTLAGVLELGLDRRWKSDWLGGWAAFLDETADGLIDGVTFAPANDNSEWRRAA